MNDESDSTILQTGNDDNNNDDKESVCSSQNSDDTEQLIQTINSGSKTIKTIHHTKNSSINSKTKNNKRKRQHCLNSDDDTTNCSFEDGNVENYIYSSHDDSSEIRLTYTAANISSTRNNSEGKEKNDDDSQAIKQKPSNYSSNSSTSSASSIDTVILKQRIRQPLSTININRNNDKITNSLPTDTRSTIRETFLATMALTAGSSTFSRQQQDGTSLTYTATKSTTGSDVDLQIVNMSKDNPGDTEIDTENEYESLYPTNINSTGNDDDKENDVASVDTEQLLHTIRHAGLIHSSTKSSKVLSSKQSNETKTSRNEIGNIPNTIEAPATRPISSSVVTNNEIATTSTDNCNNNKYPQMNNNDDIENNNGNTDDIFALPEHDSDDDDNESMSSSSTTASQTLLLSTIKDNQDGYKNDNENDRNIPIDDGTRIISRIQHEQVGTAHHTNPNTATVTASSNNLPFATNRTNCILTATPQPTVKLNCFNPYSKRDKTTQASCNATANDVQKQQKNLTSMRNPYSRSSLNKDNTISAAKNEKTDERCLRNAPTTAASPAQGDQSIYYSSFTRTPKETRTNQTFNSNNHGVNNDNECLTDNELIESAFFFNMKKSVADKEAAETTTHVRTTPPVQVTIRNGLHGTKQSFIPPGSVSSVSSTTNLSTNKQQYHRQQYQHQQQQQKAPFESNNNASSRQNDRNHNQFGIEDIEEFSDDDHDLCLHNRTSAYANRSVPTQRYNYRVRSDVDNHGYPIPNAVNNSTLPIFSPSLQASEQVISGTSRHQQHTLDDARIDNDFHVENHVSYDSNMATSMMHSPPFESIHQYNNNYDDNTYVDLSNMYNDNEHRYANNCSSENQSFVHRVSDMTGNCIEAYSTVVPDLGTPATFDYDHPEIIDVDDNNPFQPNFPPKYDMIADSGPTCVIPTNRSVGNAGSTAQPLYPTKFQSNAQTRNLSIHYHSQQQQQQTNPPIERRIRDSSKDPSCIQGIVLGGRPKANYNMSNESDVNIRRRFFRTTTSTDTTTAGSVTSVSSKILPISAASMPNKQFNRSAVVAQPSSAAIPPPIETTASVQNSNSIDSYFPPVGSGTGGAMNRNRYYSNSILANEVSKANQKQLVASSVCLRNDLQGGSGVGVGNFRLVKEATVANSIHTFHGSNNINSSNSTNTRSKTAKGNSTTTTAPKASYKKKKGRKKYKKRKINNSTSSSTNGSVHGRRSGGFRNNNFNNRRNQQSQGSSSSSWGGNRDDPNLHGVGGADMNF
jgi:hypothetical protein